MLNLFRLNEPLRIIFVLIILLLVRIPMILEVPEITLPELNWLIIGEKMGSGANLYTQIWDTISPIASGIYWILFVLFGKTNTPYIVITFLLIIQQAYSWNSILLSNDSFEYKNYIPSLIYGVFMILCVDFFTLSPIVIAMSFIILFLGAIIPSENDDSEKTNFRAGVYLGLATFTYLPSAILILVAVFNIVLFKAYSAKKMLVFLYGFLFVCIWFLIYFFWNDSLISLFQNYFASLFSIDKIIYNSFIDIMIVGFVPAIFLILGIFKTFTSGKFINFQINVQKTLFWYLLVSCLIFFFTPVYSLHLLIIFIPAFSFFTSHLFILINKKSLAETSFLILFLLTIFLNYNSFWGFIKPLQPTDISIKNNDSFVHEGKKILVLKNDLSFYKDNKLASPYLNYYLSQNHFEKINDYTTLIEIYNNFKDDLPEIIIDDDSQSIQKIFIKIPLLSKKYRKGENNFYYLKPNEYATH